MLHEAEVAKSKAAVVRGQPSAIGEHPSQINYQNLVQYTGKTVSASAVPILVCLRVGQKSDGADTAFQIGQNSINRGSPDNNTKAVLCWIALSQICTYNGYMFRAFR